MVRLALAVALAVWPAPRPANPPSPGHGTTFYIDSRAGSDAAAGTSVAEPWRGFANLRIRVFGPGDSILFARGSRYRGGFELRGSGSSGRPLVVTAYGEGPAPALSNPDWNPLSGSVIRVTGSWVVIDGLYFHDNANPPEPNHRNLNVQKMGAVYLAPGADHDVVRRNEFFHSPVGVKVKGSWDLVTGNDLHDAPEPMGRTWGAIAIMVTAPHNEISFNHIANYGYYGGAYGSDGGAIELDGVDPAFDGRDVRIHDNVSTGNHGFLELAGHVTDSISVTDNVSDDVDKFVGGGEMMHTTIARNTVVRTREPNADPYLFWTFYADSLSLDLRDNVFVLAPELLGLEPADHAPGHHRRGIGDQPHEGNVVLVDSAVRVDSAGLAALRRDGGSRADSALQRTAHLQTLAAAFNSGDTLSPRGGYVGRYNNNDQHHADLCVKIRSDTVQLRYADGTPSGYVLTRGKLVPLVGSGVWCPDSGMARLDAREIVYDAQGQPMLFHRGGWGFAGNDPQSAVHYGHVLLSELDRSGMRYTRPERGDSTPYAQRWHPAPLTPWIDDGQRNGNGSACTNRRLVPEHVSVHSIPTDMRYLNTAGTNAIPYAVYGDPSEDLGPAVDRNRGIKYTMLEWSWINRVGGGVARAIVKDGTAFYPCDDVPAIALAAVRDAKSRERTGWVEARYGAIRAGNGDWLYGWIVSAHRHGSDPVVKHLVP